jgi:hypothetical protein
VAGGTLGKCLATLTWLAAAGSLCQAPIHRQPGKGFYGNVGKGTVTGPGLIVFHMAAYKDFRIDEGLTLQFRSEVLMNPACHMLERLAIL